MVFHGRKWGWRAVAARLLLAPVLAAGVAAPAVALPPRTTAPAGRPAAPPAPAAPTDPAELLKLGRAALDGGQFERAEEFARRADRANPSGRWGLFGDTPESLTADVREARAKAGEAEAVRMTQAAKALVEKAARSPAEKMANLDQAYALADRAASITGPTDFFDGLLGGERPDKLKAEIDAARAELRRTTPPAQLARQTTQTSGVRQAVNTAKPGGPSGVTTAAATTPAKPAAPATPLSAKTAIPAVMPSAKPTVPTATTAAAPQVKAQAAALVAEGRKLLNTNKLVEAKAKAAEAQKLGAAFTLAEDTPDALLADVVKDGKGQVDLLVQDAQRRTASKDYAGAEAALGIAARVATGLGVNAPEIEIQTATVRAAKSGGTAAAPTAGSTPTPLPPAAPGLRIDVNVPLNSANRRPDASAEVKGPASPVAPPPTTPTVPGIPSLATEAKPAAPTVPGIVAPVIPSATEVPAPAAAKATPGLPPIAAPTLPGVVTPAAPATAAKSADASPGTGKVSAPLALVPPGTPPARPAGKDLIDQARKELTRGGDLELARKLATEAHTDAAAKADAQAVLREIDAERGQRKRAEASASLKGAAESAAARQYEQALRVLRLIDAELLSADEKATMAHLAERCAAEAAKIAGGASPVSTPVASPAGAKPALAPPTGLSDQVKALGEVEFQKLRSEGLDAESKAQQAFNRGETDLAITLLTDFIAQAKASSLSDARKDLLTRSADRRLDTFRLMKRQMDFLTKEARDKRDARDAVASKSLATQQKQDEIRKKVAEVHDLIKRDQFRDAEALALQLKTLEPDDPTLEAVYELAKRQRRVADYNRIKDDKEQFFVEGLNGVEQQGPYLDTKNPLHVDVERALQAMRRGNGSELYAKTMTPTERQIEVKLDQPLSVEFKDAPLRDVLARLRQETGLNISTDDAAIQAEKLSLDAVTVTESLKDLALRNVLAIVLDKARLKFVIKNNVISVTTEKMAKGQLYTKVFAVTELVTPIPDFALADHQSVAKGFAKASSPMPAWQQMGNGASVYNPQGGLQNGQMVSQPGLPGAASQPWAGPGINPNGPGGTLDNKQNPLAGSANLAPNRQNASAQLMRLISGMVQPFSWAENGGPGSLQYYDIGGALVVNQTADVIREVQDLLEALRRLQETSVSVEVRVISLSEAFFERVGIDFAMNIKGHHGTSFERQLTTGNFAPEPFINDINGRGQVVGWNPANGGFTPDLDFPIRPTSYPFSVPPFGGYPGGPNPNGGLNVGLAFLNDIQVYMFMEAAQGDRRVNIMQAPKITLFNGQTATVFVSDVAFFTIGLQVINVGGQVIYLPTQVPIPIGNSPPIPGSGASPGVSVTVQAIVSSDRRYVRMNLAPTLTALTSATVPLFPVTAFITPVFEGGSQGVPIPFTQFFQQPSVSEINVQTTVSVPDGGTVVLGGLKTLAEGRNEFGPPVLSQIPYLNRLFRNQGIGRETRHIMIMVTPRIIIQSEEEFNQTGGATAAAPPR